MPRQIHTHEFDKGHPLAKFFGEHAHRFGVGDDHFHETPDGDDARVSPHALHQPGDQCSPCGYGMIVEDPRHPEHVSRSRAAYEARGGYGR